MEVDGQGLKVDEFADLLCDCCRNAPLTYFCPMCDMRVCSDCLPKKFRRRLNGSLVCNQCGNVDTTFSTLVGPDKV